MSCTTLAEIQVCECSRDGGGEGATALGELDTRYRFRGREVVVSSSRSCFHLKLMRPFSSPRAKKA